MNWWGTDDALRGVNVGMEISLERGDTDEHRARLYYLRAQCYRFREEWEKALADIESAEALNPTAALYELKTLILVYLARGDDAVVAVEQAYKLGGFQVERREGKRDD